MNSRSIAKAALLAGCTLALTACSDGIRQHIRQRDFRADRAAERAASLPPPSPIANVADMAGWTTDLDGAIAFAKDNGHKTVVFVQAGNSPASQSMKGALLSSPVADAMSNAEKVTFDANTSPQLAARYGVSAPAVVILDMNGTAIGQQQGAIHKGSLAAAVR
ncbi:MAG: hypothetical protein ACR2IE_17675 [Candidatus Sumerlaeaceae bacterium]